MLLLGHEHVMKIPENWMSTLLILSGIALIAIAIYCEKGTKAHIMAYTMFP